MSRYQRLHVYSICESGDPLINVKTMVVVSLTFDTLVILNRHLNSWTNTYKHHWNGESDKTLRPKCNEKNV